MAIQLETIIRAVYSERYDDLDDALTTNIGEPTELRINEPLVQVSVDTEITSNFKVVIEGFSRFYIDEGVTLIIHNLQDPGDVQINIGPGKLIVLNTSVIRQSWFTGPFGGTTYLTEPINDSQITFNIRNSAKLGPAPTVISIDNEVMLHTATSGSQITVVRGYDGSSAASHGLATTTTEALDTSETGVDVADASALGATPYMILIDNEEMYVHSATGNTLNVYRGYNGTASAIHSSGATVLRQSNVYHHLATNVRDSVIESQSRMGGAVFQSLPGKWTTTGDWRPPTGSIYLGTGGDVDSINGCVWRVLGTDAHIFKIQNLVTNVNFRDMTFDCETHDTNKAVRLSGPFGTGGFCYNIQWANCRFTGGHSGVHVFDETGAYSWMALGLKFNQCWFISQKVACVISETVNGAMMFEQCSFTSSANEVAVGIRAFYAGPILIENSTFNGVNVYPQAVHTNIDSINTTSNLITTVADHKLTTGELEVVYIGAPQAESITIDVSSVTAGDVDSVVTYRGMPGSPLTVTFTVDNDDDADTVATKLRAALSGQTVLTDRFSIGGTSDEVIMRRLTMADHDGTFNFTIENNTSTGITEVLTSTDVTGATLPAATVSINRTGSEDVIDLHRQKLYFKPLNSTTGYAYLSPKHAFLPDEEDYRLNLTSTGTGLLQLRTNKPVEEGRPFAAIYASRTITGIALINCQDEGFPYSVYVEDTFEKQKPVYVLNSIMQGQMKLRGRCIVKSTGSFYVANAFSDLASASVLTDADVISSGDTIVYDSQMANYKDLGNTVVTNQTLNGFCGNSVIHKMESPDQGEMRTHSPAVSVIEHPFGLFTGPVHEFTHDRHYIQRPLIRRGLKESWQSRAERMFYDDFILDSNPTPTYPWMTGFMEIRANPDPEVYDYGRDGLYRSGHLWMRGRFGNTLYKIIEGTSGAVNVDFSIANNYYVEPLTGDMTINVDSTVGLEARQGQEVRITITTGTESHEISFGNGFFAAGTKSFHTGFQEGFIIFKFFVHATNTLVMEGEPVVVTAYGVAPPIHDDWKYPSANPELMVPNTRYLSPSASLQVFLLPENATIGDQLMVSGFGTGGWEVEQTHPSHRIIHMEGGSDGEHRTTLGEDGKLQSTDNYDYVWLVNIADKVWKINDIKGNVELV